MTPYQMLGPYARKLLADGRWHARAEVVAALAKKVPPGYASRVAANARSADARWRSRTLGKPTQARHGSTDAAAAVARGARITAARALEAKEFEKRVLANGSRQVRLAR